MIGVFSALVASGSATAISNAMGNYDKEGLLNKRKADHRWLPWEGIEKDVKTEEIKAYYSIEDEVKNWVADIEELFEPKNTSHIPELCEAFPGQSIFGRSDVMSVIEIKPSRASDLLKDMAEHGIIEPVTGHGKGKYRFKKQKGLSRWDFHHE